MYNKIYILGFLMILNGIAAQSRTINTAIHAHIAIEAPATLAFFSPEVQFNAGVVLPINLAEGQAYFSPASRAVNAPEESYREAPVVYNGRQDFLFPLGAAGHYYPLQLRNPSEGLLRLAFKWEPHLHQFDLETPYPNNPLFHWTVAGDKKGRIELQWNTFQNQDAWSPQPQHLRLMGYTGAQWEWIPTQLITPAQDQFPTTTFRLRSQEEVDFSRYTALTLADANTTRLKVSEAITPNGDGINDRWYIQDIDTYPQTEITVYNRLGVKAFSHKGNYQNNWDGTFNGKPLPSAPYFYQLDLDQNGEIDQQGWLYINDQ